MYNQRESSVQQTKGRQGVAVRNLRGLIIVSFVVLTACVSKQTSQMQVKREDPRTKAASYNTQLGLAYLDQGNIKRAKKKLLLALSQAPNSPEVNGSMAYYLETTGELNKADAYYKKAIKLAPNSGAQLNNYGAYLCRRGLYLEANHRFEQAAKDPRYLNTAAAYENAGLCSMAIPDIKKAKNYFDKALMQDPKRIQSLQQLVVISQRLKNSRQALAYADVLDKNKQLNAESAHYAYLASKSLGDANKTLHYRVLLQRQFSSSKYNQQLLASEHSDDEQYSRIS